MYKKNDNKSHDTSIHPDYSAVCRIVLLCNLIAYDCFTGMVIGGILAGIVILYIILTVVLVLYILKRRYFFITSKTLVP